MCLPGISRSEGRGQGLSYKLCFLRALSSSILPFKRFGLNFFFLNFIHRRRLIVTVGQQMEDVLMYENVAMIKPSVLHIPNAYTFTFIFFLSDDLRYNGLRRLVLRLPLITSDRRFIDIKNSPSCSIPFQRHEFRGWYTFYSVILGPRCLMLGSAPLSSLCHGIHCSLLQLQLLCSYSYEEEGARRFPPTRGTVQDADIPRLPGLLYYMRVGFRVFCTYLRVGVMRRGRSSSCDSRAGPSVRPSHYPGTSCQLRETP